MKKLMKGFAVLMAVILLTGCMKLNVNVEFKEDGSCSLGMEMLMSKDLLSMGDQTTEDMIEQMKSQGDYEGATIKEISKTIDDTEYEGFTITQEFKKDEYNDFNFVIDDEKGTYRIEFPKEFLDSLAGSMGTDGMDMFDDEEMTPSQLKVMGVEMNMNIIMPGTDVKSNIGTVDGNTIKIDLLELMSQKEMPNSIEITSVKGNDFNVMLIVGIVAAVAVIGGVIYFVMNKNKKNTQVVVEQADTDNTVEPTTVETTSEENIDNQ